MGIGWVEMLFKCPKCKKEFIFYDTREVAQLKSLGCKCSKTNKTFKELNLKRGKLFKDANPEFIEKYWDEEENAKRGISKESLTYGQWKDVSLCCKGCGFKWVRQAPRLIEAKCCPKCLRKDIEKKFISLIEASRERVEMFWNWELNSLEGLSPYEVGKNSHKEVNLKCPKCDAEFRKRADTFIESGKICPVCKCGVKSNQELVSKYKEKINDFWDYELNNLEHIYMEYVSVFNTKVNLKCKKCGYSWKDYTLGDITHYNLGCPACAGQKVLKGFNDLYSQRKEKVDKYWDWGKNTFKPNEVTLNSNKFAYFNCPDCGYSWRSRINIFQEGGCPCCNGRHVVKDRNDFYFKHINLVNNYWDWGLNTEEGTSPDQYTSGSTKKVHLKCKKCGGTWSDYSVRDLSSGLGCPYCSGQRVLKGYNDLGSRFPNIALDWDYERNILKPEEVSYGSSKKVHWKCHKCGCDWKTKVTDRTLSKRSTGCPQCAVNNRPTVSKAETEIADFIKSFHKGVIETSKREILSHNQELDIYIPEKRIAFEYNGLYWHSEKEKKQKAHWDKMHECEKLGIKLFYIWEDVWRDKKDIVKRLIMSKLGYYSGAKVNARDCEIKEITKEIAFKFLDENHIQGKVQSSKYIALISKEDKIVAVCQFLIFDRAKNIWVLTRYATNSMVRGGFTKLLKYFERVYKPTRLVTFSDNDISDGNLYNINGFVMEEELREDYYYVDSTFSKRMHKFNYRKERFERDKNLIYEPNLTELELAELNNLIRVFDSGKKRWVKTY